MSRFFGKVAIVTGASSGIGRATAVLLAKECAKVVVASRREREGQQTVQLIQEANGDGIFVKTDVTKEEDIKILINTTIEKFGKLDYAFNNAGNVLSPRPLTDYTQDDFDYLCNGNLKSVWLCMKYQVPQMLKQGGGSIVNNASASGLVGAPYASIYSASKHGVIGITKSAAVEYANLGIRVNAVCPAAIHTDMFDRLISSNEDIEAKIVALHPIGRVGKSEEVANAVLWFFSDKASFVTGQSLAIDGGYTAQ